MFDSVCRHGSRGMRAEAGCCWLVSFGGGNFYKSKQLLALVSPQSASSSSSSIFCLQTSPPPSFPAPPPVADSRNGTTENRDPAHHGEQTQRAFSVCSSLSRLYIHHLFHLTAPRLPQSLAFFGPPLPPARIIFGSRLTASFSLA